MTKARRIDAQNRATTRTLLPLVALGGGLAVTPAAALELGDISVQSNLGQPLRASIAYALAPNEMLSSTCVSVSSGQSTGGLPGIGKSAVSITEGAIVITGQEAIREPMLGTRVTVNCPYTPNLSREYMLFVDPASVTSARVATPPAAQAVAAPAPMQRTPVANTPIGASGTYRVRPGDTLSDIVRRIDNRSMKLWPAVNLIFAANPDAFIDNDPNKLKTGTSLTIPSLDGSAPVVAPPTVTATFATASGPAETTPVSDVYDPVAAATGAEVAEEAAATAAQDEPASAGTEDAAATAVATDITDSTADLKPGDVVYDYEQVAPGETIVIPDTELDGPRTTSTSPNVPSAVVSTGARSESTSLVAWLVGGGLALIAALVFFGRRLRRRPGSTPLAAAAPAAGEDAADAFAGYDIDDDSPTEENLVLDADLEIGTGFEHGVDMDVAHDFGFAATTDLDLELPFEPEAPADASTDIIPPVNMNVESILESEVLPEDDDYDMSVIMDATKMPQPEEVTERDLKAVEVRSADESTISDASYTISREVDYDILEQDYEDELTATQALNQEIQRAAEALARDLGEAGDDDATSALPAAALDELDKTAELHASDDEEKTAEFEASYDPNDTNAVTVNISHDDETTEMPVANDDETTEMEIESGKVDTKRMG